MRESIIFIGVILAIIIFVSGCTQQTQISNLSSNETINATLPVAEAVAPVEEAAPAETIKEPYELALNLSDLNSSSFSSTFKDEWRLLERTERTKADVASWALERGWKGGYRVSFYSGNDAVGRTEIYQALSIYPLENITLILKKDNTSSYFYWQNLSLHNDYYDLQDLSDPKIGNKSIAYRVIISFPNKSVVTVHTIEFYRMNVYEMLEMSGTVSDYELLKDLARKAESKIT